MLRVLVLCTWFFVLTLIAEAKNKVQRTKCLTPTLLRATLSLSMFGRLSGRCLGSRCTRSETANHSLRSVRGLHSRSDHLGKQVNIIVRLARHVFSNRVQDFQEFWLAIHGLSWALGLRPLVLGLSTLYLVLFTLIRYSNGSQRTKNKALTTKYKVRRPKPIDLKTSLHFFRRLRY